MEIELIASAAVPMFVRNTNCGGDGVETVWLPKPSVPGNSAMPEPAASGGKRPGPPGTPTPAVVVEDVRAVVDRVIVERTGLAPGVTVGGSNVQVVCGV